MANSAGPDQAPLCLIYVDTVCPNVSVRISRVCTVRLPYIVVISIFKLLITWILGHLYYYSWQFKLWIIVLTPHLTYFTHFGTINRWNHDKYLCKGAPHNRGRCTIVRGNRLRMEYDRVVLGTEVRLTGDTKIHSFSVLSCVHTLGVMLRFDKILVAVKPVQFLTVPVQSNEHTPTHAHTYTHT